MSHQRRGYAASAAARAAEMNGVGWPTTRAGERLREKKYSTSKQMHTNGYNDFFSDPEYSPEPSRSDRRMDDDRGDRRPAPFLYQFDGDDSDSGNDSIDNAEDFLAPMRSAYSEPVTLAPRQNTRHQPPPQQHHRSRLSQPRQHRANSFDSTEREALLDRIGQLSSHEAQTAAALARATAQNAVLVEEVSHWRAVAKEAASSRRAAREALSDVSAENARLAAAYSAQRLEAEALNEALFHERAQGGAREEELERALHVAKSNLNDIASRTQKSNQKINDGDNIDTAPTSSTAAAGTTTNTRATTATWDQERQDLLSLLERLQEQLATHALQQQEAAQQTPQKRPSSGHGRQGAAVADTNEQDSTPSRSSSRSTPVVYNLNMERKTPTPQRRTPGKTPPATAPGAPRTRPTPVRTKYQMPRSNDDESNVPSSAYTNNPAGSATNPPTSGFKSANPFEENSKTPAPTEPLGVRCEASYDSTTTNIAPDHINEGLATRNQATPVAQTPPLSATRPSSGDAHAATTPRSVPAARPASPSPKKQTVAELKAVADKLLCRKRYDEALRQYSAALSAAERNAALKGDAEDDGIPMVVSLLCSRATALTATGRYLESAADCCRAEKLTSLSNGSCPRAIDLRAEAFSLMGAFDLASDDLAKLYQISTSSNHHHTSNNTGLGASSGRHPAAPAIVARLQDARRAAADSGSSRNHYAILGVKSSATATEIKSAYRSLALRLHPDKAAEALGHGTATLLFSLLSAAHATLKNTQSRRAYDLQLLRQKYVNGSSSSTGDMGSYRR